MSIDLIGQLISRLTDSFLSCGLSEEASKTAVMRLGNLVDSAPSQGLFDDALDTINWLDWLRHRSNEFEAVNVAVLLREISRARGAYGTRCSSEVFAFFKNLRIPSAYSDVIEHLVALPGSDTSWLPSTADEAVVLDVERSWFGSPSARYRQRVAAIRTLGASVGRESWSVERLKNLTHIFESGLIYFLPETRSALEGRAFLNLSFEIAEIRAGQAGTNTAIFNSEKKG